MRNPLTIGPALWAIRADVDLDGLLATLSGITPETAVWFAAAPYMQSRGTNKIAIVPVQGLLTQDGPNWLGSSYAGISKAVDDAASDPDVKHIVLAVDSPGGEVIGCPECAAVIASAAKIKPVSAMVEGQAASAAYWLTSQASTVTVTPSGEVGSVGIKMRHTDISKKLENEGVKVTELTSGANKSAFSPFKPLAAEAQAEMQSRMDDVHAGFISAVAVGRGQRASQDIQAKRFGEGSMFSAKEAAGHGLVDSVLSTRDFFKQIIPKAETSQSLHARLELTKARMDIDFS